MSYTFTQTGAEIQDILDQVPTNTSDISAINTTLTDINSGYAGVTPEAGDVPTATWTVAYNYGNVSPGVYLVEYGGQFAANATGARTVGINTSTSSMSNSRWNPTMAAAGSGTTRMSFARILEVTSTAPIVLWAYQSSGSTLSFSPYMRIVRLR